MTVYNHSWFNWALVTMVTFILQGIANKATKDNRT
jgi:hypothetical protein